MDSDWLPPLKRKVKFQIFCLASSPNGSIFDTHNLEQIDSNKNFKKVEEICHYQMKLLGYHPVDDAAVTGIIRDIPQPAAQLESFDWINPVQKFSEMNRCEFYEKHYQNCKSW